jgi:uncharacterized protein DUF6599
MHLKKSWPATPAIILILAASLAVCAQQAAPAARQAGAAEVIPLASSSSPSRLLPDTLAGFKATGDIRQVERENLRDLVGDKAAVSREYLVTSAASREYGRARVDVFETQNQFAAFGLFTFNTGTSNSKLLAGEPGSGRAQVDGELVFWKGNFFVRVGDSNAKAARGSAALHEALARGVAAAIVPRNPAVTRPPLLDSLPARSKVPGSERYLLGPESLDAFVEHGGEMFELAGDTEAVIGEYIREGSNGNASAPQRFVPTTPQAGGANGETTTASDSRLKLLIVECHTPQIATDAMTRVTSYVSSLAESEQQNIIAKRTGNYIVVAVNAGDREFAEGLIDSVQYPYTVKWLRNPLWPTNDPFRTQKAAEMLLSTFGLLGLILMTVLVVGTVFGATIFLKRRKRQQEIFSDAGGMLRLDIDQFESVILGLPPKRSEE